MYCYSNGETSIEVRESVREKDVYVIQSAAGHVNDHFMELLIMISACKTASAKKVTAVLPLFPYSRQPDLPYNKKGAPKVKRSVTTSTSNEISNNERKEGHKYDFDKSPLLGGGIGTAGPRNNSNNNNGNIPPVPANEALHKTLANLKVNEPTTPTHNASSSTTLGHLSNDNIQPLISMLTASPKIPHANDISSGRPNLISLSSASSIPSTPLSGGFNLDVAHLEYNTGYKEWVAQSGTLIADLLTCAGADHIITMDLHDPQFQGFFNIPVDNLYANQLLQQYIIQCIPNYLDSVIVSPDAGGAKRATAIADSLHIGFALIHKERRHHHMNNNKNRDHKRSLSNTSFKSTTSNVSTTSTFLNSTNSSPGLTPTTVSTSNFNTPSTTNMNGNGSVSGSKITTMLVGDVKNRVCIIIDDLVDTSLTITRASKLLKDQGAKKVYALITHCIFSGDAIQRIKKSNIDLIITTNTTPQEKHQKELGNKLRVLDTSKIFAEAIRRIHNGESVSRLFEHVGF